MGRMDRALLTLPPPHPHHRSAAALAGAERSWAETTGYTASAGWSRSASCQSQEKAALLSSAVPAAAHSLVLARSPQGGLLARLPFKLVNVVA